MNKKFVLLGTIFFFLLTGAFAVQVDAFSAVPFAISDEYGETPSSIGVGVGFGFTSLDKDKSFGIMMNGIVYYKFLDFPAGSFVGGISPFGLDFIFGCTAVPLNTKIVSIPVTIAFHTRLAFLEGSTDLDMGIGGTVGVNFWTSKVGIFVRGLVYLDLTRVRFNYEGSESVQTTKLSSFGATPQVGVTIPLGKKPATKQ
jgi:hypothetical protein